MIEAFDESKFDRIASDQENNGNLCRCSLGCERRVAPADGRDDGDTTANKVAGEHAKSIVVSFRPAILDANVLALHKADFLQTHVEGANERCPLRACMTSEDADDRHGRL